MGIGLLGMGVVGGGVVAALQQKRDQLIELIGCPAELMGVLVRDTARPRAHQISASLLTTHVEDILDNPDVDIVVEVMGGQDPALDYILKGVSMGRHIVELACAASVAYLGGVGRSLLRFYVCLCRFIYKKMCVL